MPVALGADDPLLFGPRLVKQYAIARDVHGFTPAELAELARMSVRGSPPRRTRGPACWPASMTGWPPTMKGKP